MCDICLVNDTGSLVGRPILTACVDTYSGLCCGYSLSWEGGVYSLRGLMLNIISDKVEWCGGFGISNQKKDWDCNMLPASFITDMGSETPARYISIRASSTLLSRRRYRFVNVRFKRDSLQAGHMECNIAGGGGKAS